MPPPLKEWKADSQIGEASRQSVQQILQTLFLAAQSDGQPLTLPLPSLTCCNAESHRHRL